VTSDVVYITPHLKGREAALAAKLESAEGTIGGFNMIAAVLALFGIGKMLIRKRMQQIRASRRAPAMAQEQALADTPAIRSS